MSTTHQTPAFDPTLFGYWAGEDLGDFTPHDGFSMGAQQAREATILQLQHPGNCADCGHRSDCALHSRPALPVEPCNCRTTSATVEIPDSITADFARDRAEVEAIYANTIPSHKPLAELWSRVADAVEARS